MGQVIAIDGPAGAGKSTIARNLAARLGFIYVDTGAMYRAVALGAIRAGVPIDDQAAVAAIAEQSKIALTPDRLVLLDGEDVTGKIRDAAVTANASKVAALGAVRTALVARQRAMALTGNLVMEGRDIGTVVFPDATVKIFLDADARERAKRRAGETPGAEIERLAAEMRERDERDRGRSESPLLQAPDAVYLDSTGMTPDQVEDAILAVARKKLQTEGTTTANGQG